MKKIFFLAFFLHAAILNFAADTLTRRIAEANISITLPNDQWKLDEKFESKGFTVYIFNRTTIVDSLNNKISPSISVVVENVDTGTDLIQYSILKRYKQPFKVEEVFSHESGKINYLKAIGYKGNYLDEQKSHTIYVVHAINGTKGIQVICDATTSIFNQLNEEFLILLRSIK